MFGFQGIILSCYAYNIYWKTRSVLPNGLRSKAFFLDSSMVEHSAVNRVVVGSSPTRGVCLVNRDIWLHGQAVKTSPFHGGNTGSSPVEVTIFSSSVTTLGL